MDTGTPGKEVSQELTRESLIAISQDTEAPSKEVSQELIRESLIAIYQDNQTPGTVSRELTRESLIAISQAIPDQLISTELSSEDFVIPELVEVKAGDDAASYRSKLISISYPQSPNTNTLPVKDYHFISYSLDPQQLPES